MSETFAEKRRHIRIFFPVDDTVTGSLTMKNESTARPVKILNLSEGGLQLSMLRDKKCSLAQGSLALIMDIKGYQKLSLMEPAVIQVRWIMDNTYFDHIVFGVQFRDLTLESKGLLRDFVADWLQRFDQQ